MSRYGWAFNWRTDKASIYVKKNSSGLTSIYDMLPGFPGIVGVYDLEDQDERQGFLTEFSEKKRG